MAFDFTRREHHLLAVTNFDSLLLQCKQHWRFADIEAQWHVRHAFFLENLFDLFRGLFEQTNFRPDGAAHSGITGKDVILSQPRTADSMMARRRAEVPDPRLPGTREQRISNQFVSRPFADDGAGDVADVVLVEAQHSSQTRLRQRFARSRQPVSMQAPELNAFLEIDLRRSRSL